MDAVSGCLENCSLRHTTPDGRLVHHYGRAGGTAAQVPMVERHGHRAGAKGYCNAAVLQTGSEPL